MVSGGGLVGMINMDGEPVSSEILKEIAIRFFIVDRTEKRQYIDRSVGLGHPATRNYRFK